MSSKVEYRVRPITRYVVTRYEASEPDANGRQHASCDQRGIYENGEVAYQVAYALCKAEHDASGEPAESVNFSYPALPDGVSIAPSPY